MHAVTRREFTRQMVGSITAFTLIEGLFSSNLFAEDVKPIVQNWVRDLQELCSALKEQKLTDVVFQAKLEELYRRIALAELVKFVDLERLARTTRFPERGAAGLTIDFDKIEGLPRKLAFGRQIFAMKKGRSIVPHGHDNMATGFIVLSGTCVGKHYDRVVDNHDHYLIKPTIDRVFTPGETSSISDHKDNVHWFQADSDTAFVFNLHVLGYNRASDKTPARVYVDPEGEKTADGLIVARKISSAECHRKYG